MSAVSFKNHFIKAFFFSFLTLGLGWSASATSVYTPDWSLINIRLTDVAQDHINAFGFVLDAHAEVDVAATDWDKGDLRLRFDVQSVDLSLLSTPNPVSVQLTGQFAVNTVDLGLTKEVDVEAEISLSGGVIHVLRHINELIADCSIYDPTETFMVHFCAYSDHIAQNDDPASYQPALESLRDAILSLSPQSSPLLFRNKGWMEDFFDVLAQAIVTGDESSSSVVADIDLSTLLSFPVQGQATLRIDASAITLSLKGKAVLSNADYDSYKQVLGNGLSLFQNGDQDFMSEVYQYSFLIFGLIEGFLN